MTGAGALLLDPDPHRVLVAVDSHLDNALGMTGGFAFAPEASARAAEIPGFAGGDSLLQRLRVHVGDHEHVARSRIGDDTSDEPIGVEFGRKHAAFLDLVN